MKILSLDEPMSKSNFSAWYDPRTDIMIAFEYAGHIRFFRQYFDEDPLPAKTKTLTDIIFNLRDKFKDMLGSVSYREMYRDGFIKINNINKDMVIEARGVDEDKLISLLDKVQDWAKKIGVEWNNEYAVVKPHEITSVNDLKKKFRERKVFVSNRRNTMMNAIQKEWARKASTVHIMTTGCKMSGNTLWLDVVASGMYSVRIYEMKEVAVTMFAEAKAIVGSIKGIVKLRASRKFNINDVIMTVAKGELELRLAITMDMEDASFEKKATIKDELKSKHRIDVEFI